MKRYFYFVIASIISIVAVQCATDTKKETGTDTQKATSAAASDTSVKKAKTDTVMVFIGMNSKGIGRFKNVQVAHPLDQAMAADGYKIFQTKCIACHKLSSEMLVGPGWAGVTIRRTPEWIMNWITNTKVMLDKDLAAQTDLVVCLIRMPKQELNDAQARDVLEFMRKNDGEK
ncbi:MAG: cytochrome c [Bacteroidota bacterium]|nr:cytochrome c [Bacteroidota bacterium]